MELIRGKTATTSKVMLYGLAGVGKSSLAAKFSRPLFIDVEHGLDYLDVVKTPPITRYSEFMMAVADIVKNKDDYKKEFDTIVVDSADWLIELLVAKIKGTDAATTAADRQKALETSLAQAKGGYGAGNSILMDTVHEQLLPCLQKLVTLGFTVVLIAHANQKEMMDGDGVGVKQITPKISIAQGVDKKVLSQFLEWCDHIYYIRKGDDGVRTLITESDSSALAKNRLGLTETFTVDDKFDPKVLITPKGGK